MTTELAKEAAQVEASANELWARGNWILKNHGGEINRSKSDVWGTAYREVESARREAQATLRDLTSRFDIFDLEAFVRLTGRARSECKSR